MLMTSGYPGKAHIHHLPHLDPAERRRLHGSGRIEPGRDVAVGAEVDLVAGFELGATPIPAGGHLRLAWLWPYDWAPLQTDDPEAPGHARIASAPAGADLRLTYAFRGDLIPWNHHLDVEVLSGSLRPGDRVELACRAWRAPTFVVPRAEFLFLLNPEGGDRWLQLTDVDSFRLVAGPPARLVAIAPSDAVVGESVDLVLRVEDEWGNPTRRGGPPRLHGPAGCHVGDVEPAGPHPAWRAGVRFDALPDDGAAVRLDADLPGTGLRAVANPIRVARQAPELRVFWGDLHAGQGEIGCGIGSVTHHFDFARHVAGLQFTTHQANDHHVSLDLWEQTRRETEAAHEDGRFVVFHGCEWSAWTPDGGDRNVFYRHDEPRLRRSGRFFTEDTPDPEPDLTTARPFLDALRDEAVYINMHAGGRPTNLDVHEPHIETLAEIHSTHGTSDWFVEDALRRGYRVGVTAGTDGVSGRPGADHPGSRMVRNVPSGVTAFYLPELTRDALWEGIGRRRCYATTGERILLRVDVDGQPMGSDHATAGEPRVEVAVEGTAAIEAVEVLCGADVVWTWRPAPAPGDQWLRLLWGGTEGRGTAVAQRTTWDGRLTVRHGGVAAHRPVGFVSPRDGCTRTDPHNLSWTSVTAGNRMGLDLRLEGNGARCRFASGPVTFEFAAHQVRLAPMVVDAGGLNRRVQVGPCPDVEGPRRVELSWVDTRPARGLCPYWVRVTQVDQHRAWSSPVYVTRQAHEGSRTS